MAHIVAPRVRQTSIIVGTVDFSFDTRIPGSLAFSNVMSNGDTCDYTAHYQDSFEEGTGTYSGGVLQRTTVIRSRHANGTVDTNKVNFPAGIKTIIMHFASSRYNPLLALQAGSLRFDMAQSLNGTQKDQVQANLGRLTAEAGTRMLFQQSTAPVGWVKDATLNDRAIRIVSGSVGSGGSLDFSTVFARTATDNFTLTTSHIQPHNHPGDVGNRSNNIGLRTQLVFDGAGAGLTLISWVGDVSPNNYSADAHVHSLAIYNTGGGAAHQHGIDLRVKYTDVIVAQKS